MKSALTGETLSQLWEAIKNKFVEKESGKGLSMNDFTNTLKTKLEGVEANAQVNKIEAIHINGVEFVPFDKVLKVQLSGSPIIIRTLTAGGTELTIESERINKNSILSFYTSIYGVNPTAVTVSAGSVALTFETQTGDLLVGVQING